MIEKYYSLNFEDLIAGEIPCRFKYRSVKPKSYGMDAETILTLPDSELNKRVSLKKLAPYRHLNYNAKKRIRRREKQQQQKQEEEEGRGSGPGPERQDKWQKKSKRTHQEEPKHSNQEQEQERKKKRRKKWKE